MVKESTDKKVEERRRRHRRETVAAIKRHKDYVSAALLNPEIDDEQGARPITPDPEDLSISKRSWEAAVIEWRRQLRAL